MARPLPTNNAVTNAVTANAPIALCMAEIPCVEWPEQTDPATYRSVRCLDVGIATNIAARRPTSRCLNDNDARVACRFQRPLVRDRCSRSWKGR